MWYTVEDRESQDAWHGKRCRHRSQNHPIISFDQFCFTEIKKDDRFFPAADSKRFVVLV